MKKYLILASAALVALVACNKEIAETPEVPNETVCALTFTSARPQLSADTKTAWDATTSSIVWQDTDKIKVGFSFNGAWWAQTAAYNSENASPNNHIKFYQSSETAIDSESSNIATFKLSDNFEGPTTSGDFVFYSVYPAALVDNNLDTAPNATVTLKTSQAPAVGSFDATTDIMVGTSAAITSTGLPSDAIELNWNRVVAHAALTFSNMAFNGTETPTKITLTFNSDAKVAGSFSVNIADGTIGTGSENEIILEGSGLVVDGSSITTWATVLPVSFSSLDVEIKTNKATYTRSIDGISKTFKKNARNTLTINMSTAKREATTEYEWVKKDLSAITSSDVFVIVANNGNTYAMSNDKGTSAAPDAISVTIANNKLSVAPAEKLQWNLSKSGSNYTFYPNGTTSTWLYCTSGTGNKLRVGTATSRNTFTLDATSGYLKTTDSNYIGVYNSLDWRVYASATTGNIAGQSFAFYVRTTATPSKPVPTISFGTPTTEVNIGESVTNAATISVNGLTITYSSSDDTIASVDATTGEVTGEAAGTATITASFAGNDTYDAASADYEITVVDPNANDGSANKPYTASEAYTAASALSSSESVANVYVQGYISTITYAYSSTNNNISFNISDGGLTTGNQLNIFKMPATDASDFMVGDFVKIKGTLLNYKGNTPEIDANAELISQVKAPRFSVKAGTYTSAQTVSLTSTDGATIYYTINGSDPTTSSASYSSAITISETTTVKAFAIKDGISSKVSTATYTIDSTPVVTADVTYDFTGTDWSVSNGTLTDGTVSFTGEGGTNFKMNEGYFFMGKSGAYLTFPTYSSDVEKIVITGKSGASGSVVQNIFVGDTAVSTATTGATGENTYEIASGYQTAGTTYVLKVTSNHNTQITKIEIFYKK